MKAHAALCVARARARNVVCVEWAAKEVVEMEPANGKDVVAQADRILAQLAAKGVGAKKGVPMPETLSKVLMELQKKGKELEKTEKDDLSSVTAS